MGLEGMGAGPRAADIAGHGLEAMKQLAIGQEPTVEQLAGLEAIIDAEIWPAIDIIDNAFQVTHPLWTHFSTDAAIHARIEKVIPSIGRIELLGHPSLPYGGTGFVVGNGLIMTNRHVAEIFASGVGDRHVRFVNGSAAGIDFLRERSRTTGPTFRVSRVKMIHPYWDMALLEVDGLPAGKWTGTTSSSSAIRHSMAAIRRRSRTTCSGARTASNGCSRAN